MESIVGPSADRGYHSTPEGTPQPQGVPVATPSAPTISEMLKDAYHLLRMRAVVVNVTRQQPEDPRRDNRAKPLEPTIIGYRFRVPPGGMITQTTSDVAAACADLSDRMRAATQASHTHIVNRMKTLIAQDSLSMQAIKDLSELQTQQEGVAAIARFVPGGSGNKQIRSEAAGLEITFTDKTQIYDLLDAYNGVIEAIIDTAMADIQIRLTAAILRVGCPTP